MIQADLHIHTVYSSDSLIQPKSLVDMLVAHSFIKVAAVTDHDSVRGCKATVELASAYPDILIIPGVEISTPQGDMLILGTEELPPKPWAPEDIVDFTKSIGGVSIVAHPFREYGMGEFARNYKFDAVEVLQVGAHLPSGFGHLGHLDVRKLLESMGLPGTAGSDAHQVSELFTVNAKIEANLNVESVLKAIKKGFVSAQMTKG